MANSGTIRLSHRLITQGASPRDDLSKIFVGELQTQGNRLTRELIDLSSCSQPSRARLILGPNGNGKTLLNFIMQQAASKLNVKLGDRGLETAPSLNVLYSHVSMNDKKPSNYALELAKNLKRSIYEPAVFTYSIIAQCIVDNFISQQRSAIRSIPMIPVRWGLKKIIKQWEETLGGMFTADEIDPFTSILDSLFEKLQRKMNREWTKKRFIAYASRRQLSSFLVRYLTTNNYPLSSRQLHEDIIRDLGQYQSTGTPLDAIRALVQITGDVGCKVLLLMLDDCNLGEPPAILLTLLDALHSFEGPKVYLVVTGVQEVWEGYGLEQLADKSLYEKLYIFGDPVHVKPPSGQDLELLFDRLRSIVNDDLADEGHWVSIDVEDKNSLLQNCPETSFRQATHHILGHLLDPKIQEGRGG